MRKKRRSTLRSVLTPVMAFSTSVDVLFAFAISYSIPYLIGSPGANLSAKVGFVFMAYCIITFIGSYFLVPEVTNRSLEEVDELYDVSPVCETQSDFSTACGAGNLQTQRLRASVGRSQCWNMVFWQIPKTVTARSSRLRERCRCSCLTLYFVLFYKPVWIAVSQGRTTR